MPFRARLVTKWLSKNFKSICAAVVLAGTVVPAVMAYRIVWFAMSHLYHP